MKLSHHSIWPWIIILVTFVASSRSSIATVRLGFSYDKIVHFLVFGLLATSFFRIPYFLRKGWKGLLMTVLIVAFYGILDEFHQMFTKGRSVEFNDWLADTLGALLASVLYLKWHWYRSILEKPLFAKESNKLSQR